jgi:hypothetical protein
MADPLNHDITTGPAQEALRRGAKRKPRLRAAGQVRKRVTPIRRAGG